MTKADFISKSLLLESSSFGTASSSAPWRGTVNHPFPTNGPGSLRAVHHTSVGLRQDQHSACTTDWQACDESPLLWFTQVLL